MMTIPVPVHVPVLLQEVLDHLILPPAARILDLTLGLGGHAEALLAHADAEARYLGVDRDPEARALAAQRLGHDARLSILAGAYEELWEDPHFLAWRTAQAPEGFDAILADLGVSTLQLRTPGRGFSFRDEGPLDMRMDPEHGLSALDWIAEQTDESLADAIYQYGEERASRPIARAILKEGLRNVAAGSNPTAIRRGIEKAVEAAIELHRRLALPVHAGRGGAASSRRQHRCRFHQTHENDLD